LIRPSYFFGGTNIFLQGPASVEDHHIVSDIKSGSWFFLGKKKKKERKNQILAAFWTSLGLGQPIILRKVG
jgi:hypothetical protein